MTQLDSSGGWINREEYFPFGETSFGSYSKKRFRFCGKERDEESSLYYYGARYYAPWLCGFTCVDPKALNYSYQGSYCYAGNNPIMLEDINGMGPRDGGQSSGGKTKTQVKTVSPNVNHVTKDQTTEAAGGEKVSIHTEYDVTFHDDNTWTTSNGKSTITVQDTQGHTTSKDITFENRSGKTNESDVHYHHKEFSSLHKQNSKSTSNQTRKTHSSVSHPSDEHPTGNHQTGTHGAAQPTARKSSPVDNSNSNTPKNTSNSNNKSTASTNSKDESVAELIVNFIGKLQSTLDAIVGTFGSPTVKAAIKKISEFVTSRMKGALEFSGYLVNRLNLIYHLSMDAGREKAEELIKDTVSLVLEFAGDIAEAFGPVVEGAIEAVNLAWNMANMFFVNAQTYAADQLLKLMGYGELLKGNKK